jgi:hypothetical protein
MSALGHKRTSLNSVGIVRSVSLSAAMKRPARLVVVLLLRHLAAAEFSENRDRLFGSIEPINTYAVVGVGVFPDLEHIGRSVVVKFHGQCIRREDIIVRRCLHMWSRWRSVGIMRTVRARACARVMGSYWDAMTTSSAVNSDCNPPWKRRPAELTAMPPGAR